VSGAAAMELENRITLVTGGSGGIGSAACQAFARAGASVAVHYWRGSDRADDVVRAIEAEGGRAFALQADITNPAEVARMMGELTTLPASRSSTCCSTTRASSRALL
jgi:NAD(P)-dependent dehydrogenase (short-subunit alcohol dehydrogenase family)